MAWTKVTKASGTTWTKVTKATGDIAQTGGGTPIGLLLALTTSGTAGSSIWKRISKPSGTSWTKITKPT